MMSTTKVSIKAILKMGVCAALVMAVNLLPVNLANAELAKPDGKVLLIVAGDVGETNMGAEAHLDRDLLQSIGMKTLRTSNQYEPGVHDFKGVMLKDLLSFLGATGSTLIATALDGYSIEIPVQDANKFPVILAMEKNGKQMTVREKGPIWVVYPIDQFEELKDQKYSSRSIWQLKRIDVQ